MRKHYLDLDIDTEVDCDCGCRGFAVTKSEKTFEERWAWHGETLTSDEHRYLKEQEIEPGYNFSSKCVLEAYRAGRRQGRREMQSKPNQILLGDD